MSGDKARAFGQLDAAGNNADVVILRNSAANGDDRTLKSYETHLIVYNGGSYTQQVYLPPVSECKGKIFTIEVPDTGGHLTVSDQDDSVDWSDQVSTADDDYLQLACSGRHWVITNADMT